MYVPQGRGCSDAYPSTRAVKTPVTKELQDSEPFVPVALPSSTNYETFHNAINGSSNIPD